jgi:signal transduction histidine kinase
MTYPTRRQVEASGRPALSNLAERAYSVLLGDQDDGATMLRVVVAAVLGVAGMTLCMILIAQSVNARDSSLLYLVVVLWLAITYGRGAALLASLFAFLAQDYFFVPPIYTLYTLGPNRQSDWASLFMLLSVSVVTGYIAAHVRERERKAVSNEQAGEVARRDLLRVNLQLQEQVRMQQELTSMRQEISDRQRLVRAVIAAGEEERRRISRELHDGTGQNLTGLLLGLQALHASLPAEDPHTAQVFRLQEIAQSAQGEIHDLALELRPAALDDLGLVVALEAHVERWATITAIEVDFQCAGLQGTRLLPPIEVTLYRVIQEALNNVAKHAHARRVSLVVERRSDCIVAVIEDDGCGFDAQRVCGSAATARGLGLLGMHERVGQVGGSLTIESSPGEGAALFVRVPIDHTVAPNSGGYTEQAEHDDADEIAHLPRR